MDDKIDQRLFEYLSGDLSEEEVREVEEWIMANADNREYFRQFRRDFLKLRWGMRAGLTRGTWAALDARLRRRSMAQWTRWAAVIALLLGGGLFYYFHAGAPGDVSQVMAGKVLPGKAQATLVLSSGKTVTLDAASRRLKEVDGTSIRIVAGGMVSYEASVAGRSEEMLYNKIMIPKGGEYSMQLEDGTKVWLNAATELRYPVSFAKDRRTVYLKGEAYFEVQKDNARPFVVMADKVGIKVYGTKFNVDNYHEDRVEAVLVEGSVGMNRGGEEVRLEPGQKGQCVDGKEMSVEEVDVASYIAWKDGNFVFDNERLETVMEKLARWYDVEVVYSREEAKNVCLSGDMKRYDEIQSLLYYFERISDLRFSLSGKTVIIK